MMNPIIVINLKAYEQGTGKKALSLAKICEGIAKEYGVNITLAVQFADIYRIASSVVVTLPLCILVRIVPVRSSALSPDIASSSYDATSGFIIGPLSARMM